jgi:signal peptidase I
METSVNSLHALAAVTDDLIDDHLRSGASIRFTVPTWSMWPTLTAGDQVIVRRVNPDDLHSGDIALVRVQGAWIAHRLIGRSMEKGVVTLLTKGDNSAYSDFPSSIEDLRGVVEFVEHDGCKSTFRSNRARRWGALVAFLSRSQSYLSNVRPALLRRIVLRSNSLILRAGSVLAKQTVEQR